jgi:murein DD-endopeptidase MepM/ murein hydrolase activator NlpD
MKQWFWLFGWALLMQAGSVLMAGDLTNPTTSVAVANGVLVSTEPFVWPVSKIIGGHHVKIVSKFGHRKAPDTQLDEVHEGIDFAVPADSNIRAARSGKVLFAGYSSAYVSRKDKTDKNHLVIVRHADGKSSRYVHLNLLRVRPGQEVKAGDLLGTSSESDEWDEPVVHFEIREANGKALDPMKFFAEPVKASTP